MGRVARGLLRLVAVLLLIASAGVAVLWVRSARHRDELGYGPPSGSWRAGIITAKGQISFVVALDNDALNPGSEYGSSGWVSDLPQSSEALYLPFSTYPHVTHLWAWHGFGWVSADGNPTGDFPFPRIRMFGLPCWLLMVLLAAPAGFQTRSAVLTRRRRLSDRTKHCPTCGYDLRASPIRCPECGRAVPII